jgi:GR25 family glycosyltransferase involved in LPS biosynthesis
MIHNHFNKVFIITTSVKSDRYDYIKKTIKEKNIDCEIVFSTNKKYCAHYETINFWGGKLINTQPYISLTSAYYSIFANCLFHDYNNVLIFEDDICFEENFDEKLKLFMDNIPEDWGYINLGYCGSKLLPHGWRTNYINEYVSEISVSWSTHATAYKNKDIFQKLINRMDDINDSIEFIINYYTHIDKSFKSYTPNDIIFTQLSYRDSNIPLKRFKSLIE